MQQWISINIKERHTQRRGAGLALRTRQISLVRTRCGSCRPPWLSPFCKDCQHPQVTRHLVVENVRSAIGHKHWVVSFVVPHQAPYTDDHSRNIHNELLENEKEKPSILWGKSGTPNRIACVQVGLEMVKSSRSILPYLNRAKSRH